MVLNSALDTAIFLCEFDRRSLLKNIVDFGFGAGWILIWAEILKYYLAAENEVLHNLQYIWKISLKRSQISHPSRVAQVVGRLWRWLVDCCSGRSSLVDHSSQCPGHTGGGGLNHVFVWNTASWKTHLGKSVEISWKWKFWNRWKERAWNFKKLWKGLLENKCSPLLNA